MFIWCFLFVIVKYFVEEAVEGVQYAEHLFDSLLTVGATDKVIGYRMPDRIEAWAQILGIGKVFWEAFGNRLQTVLTHIRIERFKRRIFHNLTEAVDVINNRLTDML